MSSAAYQLSQEAEISFLEGLRPQYEDKGYKFTIHPRSSELPKFFSNYQPDAVATKQNHNVAIEVKSQLSRNAEQSIQRIREIFEGHSDWQFTVAYIGSEALQVERLPSMEGKLILERVSEIRKIAANGYVQAALILAWSLLEAALNSVRPNADKRPRTPGTVVQTLAMYGYISEELERPLRSLISLRNRIVHGDISAEPKLEDVELVLVAVEATLRGSKSAA